MDEQSHPQEPSYIKLNVSHRCPAKYRRVVFSQEVDAKLKETCLEISERYELEFLEIGTDQDHVHLAIHCDS